MNHKMNYRLNNEGGGGGNVMFVFDLLFSFLGPVYTKGKC